MTDDTISRKEVIDALGYCQTYLFDSFDKDKKISLEDAEYAIEQLPSAQPGWIPISEQMPKKAGNYLVTDHKGDIARFIFLDSKSSKDYWMRCVKAWMPLPKPYKEGD